MKYKRKFRLFIVWLGSLLVKDRYSESADKLFMAVKGFPESADELFMIVKGFPESADELFMIAKGFAVISDKLYAIYVVHGAKISIFLHISKFFFQQFSKFFSFQFFQKKIQILPI